MLAVQQSALIHIARVIVGTPNACNLATAPRAQIARSIGVGDFANPIGQTCDKCAAINCTAGIARHAKTLHQAALPLAFVIKPIKAAETAVTLGQASRKAAFIHRTIGIGF